MRHHNRLHRLLHRSRSLRTCLLRHHHRLHHRRRSLHTRLLRPADRRRRLELVRLGGLRGLALRGDLGGLADLDRRLHADRASLGLGRAPRGATLVFFGLAGALRRTGRALVLTAQLHDRGPGHGDPGHGLGPLALVLALALAPVMGLLHIAQQLHAALDQRLVEGIRVGAEAVLGLLQRHQPGLGLVRAMQREGQRREHPRQIAEARLRRLDVRERLAAAALVAQQRQTEGQLIAGAQRLPPTQRLQQFARLLRLLRDHQRLRLRRDQRRRVRAPRQPQGLGEGPRRRPPITAAQVQTTLLQGQPRVRGEAPHQSTRPHLLQQRRGLAPTGCQHAPLERRQQALNDQREQHERQQARAEHPPQHRPTRHEDQPAGDDRKGDIHTHRRPEHRPTRAQPQLRGYLRLRRIGHGQVGSRIRCGFAHGGGNMPHSRPRGKPSPCGPPACPQGHIRASPHLRRGRHGSAVRWPAPPCLQYRGRRCPSLGRPRSPSPSSARA